MEDPATRAVVAEVASYAPSERYALFEPRLGEARCDGYGDVLLPDRRRWSGTV